MAKTILVLAANPKNTEQLRLDQEIRDIEDGLDRSKRRNEFILKSRLATRAKDIRRAMLDHSPNIVHFCGHGAGDEGIVFEDDAGKSNFVSTGTLEEFFRLFADTVECVILNACYSEVQAEAIAQHIPYVVGMKKAIGDVAAIAFAVAFYDALGAGKSVEFAYNLARNAIQWEGVAENLTPELKIKGTQSIHHLEKTNPGETKEVDGSSIGESRSTNSKDAQTPGHLKLMFLKLGWPALVLSVIIAVLATFLPKPIPLSIWQLPVTVGIADFKNCPGASSTLKDDLNKYLGSARKKLNWLELHKSFTSTEDARSSGIANESFLVLWGKCTGTQPTYVLEWLGPESELAEPTTFEIELLNDQEISLKTLAGVLAYFAYEPEQATNLFSEVQQKWDIAPSTVQTSLNWVFGNARYQRGEQFLDLAIQTYLSALKSANSDSVRARLNNNIGTVYNRQEYLTNAIEYFNLSLKDDPNYIWPLLSRSEIFVQQGDDSAAEKDCTTALDLFGNFAPSYVCTAVLQSYKQKWTEALQASEEAILLDPTFARAYYLAGQSSQCMGEYNKAVDYFNLALKWSRTRELTERILPELAKSASHNPDPDCTN